MTAGRSIPRYAWYRLVVGLVLSTIGGVGMWSVVVALPAVQAEFGVARGDASLPYTLTMIGFGARRHPDGPDVRSIRHHRPGDRRHLALAAGYGAARRRRQDRGSTRSRTAC